MHSERGTGGMVWAPSCDGRVGDLLAHGGVRQPLALLQLELLDPDTQARLCGRRLQCHRARLARLPPARRTLADLLEGRLQLETGRVCSINAFTPAYFFAAAHLSNSASLLARPS